MRPERMWGGVRSLLAEGPELVSGRLARLEELTQLPLGGH